MKTRLAIQYLERKTRPDDNILIVIPRLVLINNWKDEFKKWKREALLQRITFVTYVSFPKKAGKWKMIIFDEAHHLSERCRQSLHAFKSEYNVLLSATVGRNLKKEITCLFPYLRTFTITTREAIKDDILPDPKVILYPMLLDNVVPSYTYVKNKGKGNKIIIPYKDRWKYSSYKGEVQIRCTAQQYYNETSSLIEWYKRKMHIPAMKNIYLHKCGERLKWLSQQKTTLGMNILLNLKKERIITFCSSIMQTQMICDYCINSNNPKSSEYLDKFNAHQINHITCAEMLNEGINLADCRIGLFLALNSSERLIVQKLGRILRHKNPVIIIPYFKHTRDEEIVTRMCENYNKELIITVNSEKEIYEEVMDKR